MDPIPQRRRIARIPVSCAVVVQDKASAWRTETEDVGARGCRIALNLRPLARGGLIRIRFERGDDRPALEALGQVVWTRGAATMSAGITFVNLPRDDLGAQPRNWIDELLAAHVRRLAADWDRAPAALSRFRDVTVHLGIPPTEGLDRPELALVRLARDGVALAEVCRSQEAMAVLVSLLERGILSVCRANPDPEGWKRALSALAGSVAAVGAHSGAAPSQK